MANPNLPCCHSCGAEGAPESFILYRLELVCATCYEDHERAAESEDSEEDTLPGAPIGSMPPCTDAEKFQWQSRDWFRWVHMERLPMLRNQFGDLR